MRMYLVDVFTGALDSWTHIASLLVILSSVSCGEHRVVVLNYSLNLVCVFCCWIVFGDLYNCSSSKWWISLLWTIVVHFNLCVCV